MNHENSWDYADTCVICQQCDRPFEPYEVESVIGEEYNYIESEICEDCNENNN